MQDDETGHISRVLDGFRTVGQESKEDIIHGETQRRKKSRGI